jgi:arabinofuranosyltransferase
MIVFLQKSRAWLWPFLIIYVWALIQTAWVGDDAYITFRSIENFIHGYGPIFNIGERVQTFTHPLWFLLQSLLNFIALPFDLPFKQHQLYFVNILASLAISIVVLAIFAYKVAPSTKSAAPGLIILTLSKAYLDYSTSGLENPLTHLLLLLFLWLYLTDSNNIFLLSLLASLAALNRQDTILFYIPALGLLFFTHLKKWHHFMLGFLPLLAWELFSVFYYGTLFPNTAYAKLNAGMSLSYSIREGIHYYQNSFKLDPLTATVILAVLLLVLFSFKKRPLTIAAGISLYLIYILYIGGDFMSGRFFSAALLTSVVLLSQFEIKPPKVYWPIVASILFVGILPIYLIPERNPSYGLIRDDWKVFMDYNHITDERRVYYDLMGLIPAIQGDLPMTKFAGENWVFVKVAAVEKVGPLGVNSYRVGPNVHIIDSNALADPLMARLPLISDDEMRIGHYKHIVPQGYVETLASGQDQIKAPNIAEYYDKLSFVIKNDLWSWSRLIEIWNLNMGKYNYLIENVKNGD